MIRYSVLIPTHRRATMLRATLDSLGGQRGDGFEVVVVCDGEDAQTRALADSYSPQYPLRWVLLPDNRGPAAARNAGARAALGALLLFLDDDTLASQDWLLYHTNSHGSVGAADVVVCGDIIETYLQQPGSVAERFLRDDRNRILRAKNFAFELPGDDFDLHAVCGVNCSIGRVAFLDAGGFDETLRYVSEDTEFGLRLHGKGFRFLHEARALVHHQSTKDLKECLAESSRHTGVADAYRLVVKHQRNAQLKNLTLLHTGGRKNRLKHRLAWKYPDALETLAVTFLRLTELANSEFFFQRWRNCASAVQYWQGVKSRGLTIDDIGRSVGQPLPVLSFHSISVPEDRQSRYWVRPERFRRFMQCLLAQGVQCVTPMELMADTFPTKRVCLTFDDGYEDFYTEVFPYVENWQLKPTIFLVMDYIGGFSAWRGMDGPHEKKLLSQPQILEMQRYGVEFGSHSLTHAWLPGLSDAELSREVAVSKSRLEDLLGAEVTCFAYPSGGVDLRVRAAVAAAGYKLAFTANPGLSFWQDPFCLNRIEVRETDRLLDLLLRIRSGRSRLAEARFALHRAISAAATHLPRPASHTIRRFARWPNPSNSGPPS